MISRELTCDSPGDINRARIVSDFGNLCERRDTRKGEDIMLWTIAGVLLVLWLLGFSMHVGGGLIHVLLVIAIVVFAFNLIAGRRSSI